jgi:hypothetical protein
MEARDIPASMQEIYYQKDPLTLKGKTEKAVNMLFQRQESILAAGGTKLKTSCYSEDVAYPLLTCVLFVSQISRQFNSLAIGQRKCCMCSPDGW